MSRIVYPGTENGRYERWRVKHKGKKPYVKPYPYATFIGRDSGGVVSGVLPWNGKIPIGTRRPKGIESNRALMLSKHYCGTIANKIRENDRNICRNRAIKKVDVQLTVAANLFEDWYERKQSYNLLMNVGKELLTFAKGWKNPDYWKRFGKKVKQPTSMPEAWITYQFGVKPLMGFVDTALNHLAEPLRVAKVRGASSYSFEFSDYKNERATVAYNGSERIMFGCTIQPNPNPNMALANIVGLSTPISTAWQVIPWAWAVDYFVNVTEQLQNLEVKHPGVFVHDWYESTKFVAQFNSRTELLYPHKNYYVSHNQSTQYFSRAVISAPTFAPTYNFPLLGSNKLANLFSAIALTMKKG